jgi:ferredoxin--NADP+ reductase
VVRVFDRILRNDAVRLLGNVEMGRDVAYGELKALYDAVVLAVGAQVPRRLGIPGEGLTGVVDATGFVDWYNAVPGAPDLAARLDARTAVVVGNGNVALDIARLLAKTDAELAAGDIDPRAAEAIAGAPLADIYVVGRRGPLHAAFTSPELSEFGTLAEAAPVVNPASLPDSADSVAEEERPKKAKNLRILKDYAAANGDADARPVKVRLVFFASPVEILGEHRVEAVRFERNRIVDGRAVGTGETFVIEAQLFVEAIGYRVKAGDGGPPVDERHGIIANEGGRVEPGVYAVGWARRGPTGVIGTNRNDSRDVVERVTADALPGGRPGPERLDSLLAERGARVVTYDGWRRIDEAEIAAAHHRSRRPRVKFTSIEEMLAVAG